MGRRIAKGVNGAITEKYLWKDAITLLAIYDASNNFIMRFNYADDRMPVSMTYNGSTYYLAYDQVGSPKVISDSFGNIVKKINYDSFGNIISDSNPTFFIPFGFAGGLHDRDTNLIRFGARDYDPSLGRWTAKDLIDFAGGDTNFYGYVTEDPINFVDPDGFQPFWTQPSPPTTSIGTDKPVWKKIGDVQTPAIAGNVAGKVRVGGIFCTCSWERIGYERTYKDKCGNINKSEPISSIFDPNNNFAITSGRSTQSGCFCPNPNGELQ